MGKDERLVVVDVSKYQPRLDYEVLAAAGVRGLIARCSYGLQTDRLFRMHVEGARGAGMFVGAYHWFDPMLSVYDQAHLMWKQVEWASTNGEPGGGVSFAAVDVEQYWQDWREFELRKVTKFIPGKVISSRAREMCMRVRAYTERTALEPVRAGDRSHIPALVYTRASFVQSWAPEMSGWIGDWDLWLAMYPYSKVKVTTSWEEFRGKWLPKLEGPKLPPGGRSWRLWQFSGDKFSLPGTGGVIDLNWFNGGEEELGKWLAMDSAGAVPVEEPGLGRWRALYALNVREGPGVAEKRVGRLGNGEVVEALEVRRSGGKGEADNVRPEEEVWVRFEGGWAAALHKRVRLMEKVGGVDG